MTYNHNSPKIDRFIGKRVTVEFTDGTVYIGLLKGFNEKIDRYVLVNVLNDKTGFPTTNTEFRKSHVKRIEVKHG